MEDKKINIKYGLMVIHPNPSIKSQELEILHFCGYESKPGINEITHLQEELKTDEIFGLTEIANELVILPAPEDIVEKYRNMLNNG